MRSRMDVALGVAVDLTGVARREILDGRQFKETVRARRLAAWLCVKVMGCSLAGTGRYLGKDHSSIHATCVAAEAARRFDAGWLALTERARAALEARLGDPSSWRAQAAERARVVVQMAADKARAAASRRQLSELQQPVEAVFWNGHEFDNPANVRLKLQRQNERFCAAMRAALAEEGQP